MKYLYTLFLIVFLVSCKSNLAVDNNVKKQFVNDIKKISKEKYLDSIESMNISDSIKLEIHRRINIVDVNFKYLEFFLLESYTNASIYPEVSNEFYDVINSLNQNIRDNDLCDCYYQPVKLRSEIDFNNEEVRFKLFQLEMKSLLPKKQKLFECVFNYRPLKAYKNKPFDKEDTILVKKIFNIDL